jgi:hypothetical protein
MPPILGVASSGSGGRAPGAGLGGRIQALNQSTFAGRVRQLLYYGGVGYAVYKIVTSEDPVHQAILTLSDYATEGRVGRAEAVLDQIRQLDPALAELLGVASSGTVAAAPPITVLPTIN